MSVESEVFNDYGLSRFQIRNLPQIHPTCIRPGRKRRDISKSLRDRVFDAKGRVCEICGRAEGDMAESVPHRWRDGTTWTHFFQVAITLDHIVPIALGGCSHFHNLRPLCSQCNCRKGGRI